MPHRYQCISQNHRQSYKLTNNNVHSANQRQCIERNTIKLYGALRKDTSFLSVVKAGQHNLKSFSKKYYKTVIRKHINQT